MAYHMCAQFSFDVPLNQDTGVYVRTYVCTYVCIDMYVPELHMLSLGLHWFSTLYMKVWEK